MPFVNHLREMKTKLRGNIRCQNVGINHLGTEVTYFKNSTFSKKIESRGSGLRSISSSFKGKKICE